MAFRAYKLNHTKHIVPAISFLFIRMKNAYEQNKLRDLQLNNGRVKYGTWPFMFTAGGVLNIIFY